MINARSRTRFSIVAAVLAAGSLLSASARAEDAAPPAPPVAPAPAAPPEHKPVQKIEQPFLVGLVGTWNVASKSMRGESSGVARVRMAAGGTAIVQEGRISLGDRTLRSLSVLRLAEDGTTVKSWRFDNQQHGDVTSFQGTASADGVELSGDSGVVIRMKKNEHGLEVTTEMNGQRISTSTYTKAEKSENDAEFDAPDAPKEGVRAAMIGAWDAVGEWLMPGKDGKVQSIAEKGGCTFRWALGGVALVHEFDMTSAMGPSQGVGVHRWPDDQSSTKVWLFSNDMVDPLFMDGPNSDTGWEGTASLPGGAGEMKLHWAKKGDGFEMKFDMGGKPAGHETYTRKK